MDIIVLRDTYRQVLTVPKKGSLHLSDQLSISKTDDRLIYQSKEKEAPLETDIRIGDLVVYPHPNNQRCYSLDGLLRVVIGTQVGSDLLSGDPAVTLLLIKADDGSWQLQNLGVPIYLNNHLISQNQQLPFGAELAFGNSCLKVFPKEIWVSGTVKNASLLEVAESAYHYYEDYPDYHRSPRLIYRLSESKVTVNAPPAEPNKPRNELLRMLIPPLVMIGVVILISVFQPRGLYILMAVAMSITTAIFSVQNYFRNKREYKQSLADRISAYHAYLSDKSIQLTTLANEQRRGQFYHYPDLTTLDSLVQELSHRLYEKTPQQFDFLYYRLGLGEVPTSYRLDYSQQERSGVKDPLEVEGFALYEAHKTLTDMPVLANLKNGPVGYVGERSLVLEQLQLLIHQLAVFHSYHDLQFITIMPETEKDQWQWMRWLPHATLQDVNVRGFVYNERTRDQVLNRLMEILRQRQLQQKEAGRNQELIHLPHYVVLITDETLIMDHVIMEFFAEDPTALGCSLIVVQDVMRALPENVETVIHLKDQTTGELVMEEGILKEQAFALDHFPENYDKERISRRLAPLNHLKTLQSAIPESVTFLELYQVATVEELGVFERWQSHSPHQSLAVSLGLRGSEDYVKLDLHERAHGPHGLIAGTTGSGKSELIQSYILSLAVNFHPHDVAFLLIDYKGGGMANLFNDLPHVLGTITNLDGNQSMRALASIKAENERRQRLFAEAGVNHIHAYQKKYKQGEVSEPLPHLIIISDEFAELKDEQPDFITQLVSTARIGRSLGVNLILATQKPAGVVNDQIRSNSNFRISLKVADKADSQEMLHTPDAATITQAGRAYLQVGNNEVYELFQSAWSGADYQPDKEDQGIDDQTIFAINELGQYEALNQDLSGLDEATDIREVPTELEAVVQHIQQVMRDQKIAQLAQPWLPPLKEKIYLKKVDFQKAWSKKAVSALSFTIGLADMPYAQKQEEVSIDLISDGHVALFGGPSTGKTTFLQTAILDLVRHYSPEDLELYLIDFGTNGLSNFQSFPHVADSFSLDRTDKLLKLIQRLKTIRSHRKRLLAKAGVATLRLYEELTGEKLPHVVVVLDNYDAMKNESFETTLANELIVLAREGIALGMHLMLTAGRQLNVRIALHSNINTQLVLHQNDASDVTNVVGSTPYRHMDAIKGRGLMAREKAIDVVQFYLPVAAANSMALLQSLQAEAEQMRQAWSGVLPKAIPMVPDILVLEEFRRRQDYQQAVQDGHLALGLHKDTVELISWKRHQSNLLYLSNDQEHQGLFLDYALDNLDLADEQVFVFAPPLHLLPEDDRYELVSDIKEISELLEASEFRLKEKFKAQDTQKENLFVFYDFANLISQLDRKAQHHLTYILDKGRQAGYSSLVLSDTGLATRIDVASKFVKTTKQMVFDMKLGEQSFLTPSNKPKQEPPLGFQEQWYLEDKKASKLQVTYIGEDNE